jgi:deoxyribonuclease V
LTRLDYAEQLFFEKLQVFLEGKKVKRSREIRRISGVDASYDGDNVAAVASVVDSKGKLLEQAACKGHATFPYVSGLFFLREGPFVTEAVRKLRKKPDLLCFDAHGLAHPRRRGLATICGIILGIPSIGIAKSKLVGEIERYKPGLARVVYEGINVGFVTENPKRFWSPGFSISIAELESLILENRVTCLTSILESHNSAKSRQTKYLSRV